MKSKREKLPNKVELQPAEKRQKVYASSLGIQLPEDATKSDAAAFINRELDNDEQAEAELIAYARAKDIVCSDYVGSKYLHNLLFDHLEEEDKIAFFCFCIHKFNCREADSNLLEHPLKDVFESFAKVYIKDGYFKASMEDYLGEDIITFGKSEKILATGKKKVIYGGSLHTRAYKEAEAYLKNNIS